MPRSLFILALLTAVTCLAQNDRGRIEGTVVSSSGISIHGVRVAIVSASGGDADSVETDSAGAFRRGDLAPGNYRLSFEATGFGVAHREAAVRPGQLTRLPVVTLSPEQSPAASTDVVRVPVVDPERVQQADTILLRQVRELPVNRRNYLNLAALTPAVADINDYVGITDAPMLQAPPSGLSFGGNNGRGNIFWLDGGENYLKSGGVRPSISQEAVAEFSVVRSNYSAEFGGGIGGIVNIVSQSGSNEFHGNLFGFLRHRSVQARNYFDPGKGAFTRSQVGGTLGGPVRKDRTFGFLAFERLQRQESSFVPILRDRSIFSRLTLSQEQLVDFLDASGIPALRALAAISRQGLVTTTFPATLALFDANSGVFPFSEADTLGSVRVDHRLSDNHHFFLRFNAGNSDSQNGQVEGLTGFNRGQISDDSDRTMMLNETHVISANLVRESRLSLNRNLHYLGNRDSIGPSLEINGYGYFGRDWLLPSLLREWHGQFQQNLFYTSGKHSVRFGVDINPVRVSARIETNLGGRFSFGEYLPLGALYNEFTGDPNAAAGLAATLTALGGARLIPNINAPITALQAFNIGIPAFYTQGFGDPSDVQWFKQYNFFINDVIRLHPKLTIHAGLRYELEMNRAVLPTDPNNLAPRIGLAWSPDEARKTVLRAGYGLFFLRNNAQTAFAILTQDAKKYNQVIVPITGLPGSRNPATGRPITSADIYQTLLAQGVIGKRAIQAADLAQFGIVPGPGFPFQFILLRPTQWQHGVAQQASFEIERAIRDVSVSAAYNFNRAAHLPRLRDTNAQYGPPGPNGALTVVPKDPLVSQLLATESAANSFYHALIFQVSRRVERRLVLNAHYTFSKSIDENTDLHLLANDPLNARAERGLSTFDQRHRFVASAIVDLPGSGRRRDGWAQALLGGFTAAPLVIVNSGRPFNVLIGQDPTTRPFGAGRNIGRGPGFANVDLRLSRRLRFGGKDSRSVELIAEGFNVLNHTNFRRLNNVVGQVTVDELPRPLAGRRGNPTEPLSFLSAFDPRQFQFALKIHF